MNFPDMVFLTHHQIGLLY